MRGMDEIKEVSSRAPFCNTGAHVNRASIKNFFAGYLPSRERSTQKNSIANHKQKVKEVFI